MRYLSFRRVGVAAFFAWALFLSQGLPLWDDDFTSWFWRIKDHSIWAYVWQWISPVSTQPQFWGFNERPVQAIIYKLGYFVSGYEGWSYFLFKSLVIAALGGMVWLWARRLIGKNANAEWAAGLAAAFAVFNGNLGAAHVLHCDLAPLAAVWFLGVTYYAWELLESIPAGNLSHRDWLAPQRRPMLKQWAILVAATYLGYKTKADLKLIPVILFLYVITIQDLRKQWRFFAVPFAAMVFLAVPWGPGIFSKLPPFIPGSSGSDIGWMWQPASFDRLLDFFINKEGWSLWSKWTQPSLALFWNLGPLFLAAAIAFLIWIGGGKLDRIPWRRLTLPTDRARIFILLWLAVVVVGISALPGINYTFRVRYGILPWIPVTILLGWVFGYFLNPGVLKRFSTPVLCLAWVIIGSQLLINANKAITVRKDMGRIMIAVDRAYEAVAKRFPNDPLALLPDFRPYDYRTDAPSSILGKTWLARMEDLRGTKEKSWPLGGTTVLTWSPTLWEELDFQERFPGCRSGVLFDWLFPCGPAQGAYLYRYIGRTADFDQIEKLNQQGKTVEALTRIKVYMQKYPKNMGGAFLAGFLGYNLGDFQTALRAYSFLEPYLPEHLPIAYNYALALRDVGQFDAAIQRLERVVSSDPRSYGGLYNLTDTYLKAGKKDRARKVAASLLEYYPNDPGAKRFSGL